MHVEAAGGIVLLVAAAVALIWANVGLHESYDDLWHTPITLGLGEGVFTQDLHFWINEGLMTVFFLVVGLEIKREIVEGTLADWQRAALPIVAAIGGMVVPAAIYLAINPSGPTQEGWGVPMATDIAFAVGVLTLLGRRAPPALRILLLAVAIIDDIGAILVIAVFYSSGLNPEAIGLVALGLFLLFLFQRIGTRPGWAYAIPLVVIWTALYRTGVHPTLAGVIVGLATPARSWIGTKGFVAVAREALDEFQTRVTRGGKDHDLIAPLDRVAFAQREAISPAVRMEHGLHRWVAFGIIPLFALANAGVYLGGIELGGPGFWSVFLGVGLGLAVGKPLGVLLAAWLAVRFRLCSLPAGLTWSGVFVIGTVAGIGFTMAIFIAELAFTDPAMLGVGKLAVLSATAVAATVALAVGRVFLAPSEVETGAVTATDVEQSTEVWLTGEVPSAPAAGAEPPADS
jgi:NhaA family Na+:H+ antiporter